MRENGLDSDALASPGSMQHDSDVNKRSPSPEMQPRVCKANVHTIVTRIATRLYGRLDPGYGEDKGEVELLYFLLLHYGAPQQLPGTDYAAVKIAALRIYYTLRNFLETGIGVALRDLIDVTVDNVAATSGD